jgi:hypothetical protein
MPRELTRIQFLKKWTRMLDNSVILPEEEVWLSHIDSFLEDIRRFLARSPEYKFKLSTVKVKDDGRLWFGWSLNSKQGQSREKGHAEWLNHRVRSIVDQYEWDSKHVGSQVATC